MFVNVLVAFYELSLSDSFNIELSYISLSNYSGFYIGGFMNQMCLTNKSFCGEIQVVWQLISAVH